MSFRYIVATRFLYSDHEKVARQVEEAFGAEILVREPCVVGRFSSVDDASVFTWIADANVSEAFVIMAEDGEMIGRSGSHLIQTHPGVHGTRIIGARDE